MSALSNAYSETRATKTMQHEDVDPEAFAALSRGIELVDSNADQLMLLRSVGTGDFENPVSPGTFSGPLSEYASVMSSDDAREALNRWATFFAPHLDDVRFFREQIDQRVIQDPAVVLEVVGMTEQLLRASLHALQRVQTSRD